MNLKALIALAFSGVLIISCKPNAAEKKDNGLQEVRLDDKASNADIVRLPSLHPEAWGIEKLGIICTRGPISIIIERVFIAESILRFFILKIFGGIISTEF